MDLAGRALPGAAQVSITLLRGRGAATAAHTGEAALQLDELQYERGAGPCLEAATTGSTVEVPDTAADDRWHRWGADAARAGMGSVLSLSLPIGDSVNGALNVYGVPPRAFDAGAVTLAQTFARYAAVALTNAQLYDATVGLARHMQAAMESRAVIEQAKGIIMGEHRCTPDRKLRDVATALVERTQRS